MIWHPCLPLLAAAAVSIAAGCSSDEHGRQAIAGSVSLDGSPLSHGNVRFEPQQAALPIASGAVIQAGAFQIDRQRGLPPGEYRVSISCPAGFENVDRETDAGGQAEELVPPRYNRDTELTVTVSSDGDNVFRFDLKSDP